MTNDKERFSRRYGLETQDQEICIRNDAPAELREAVLGIAYEAGAWPSDLRTIICRLLRKRPNADNFSEYPNIDGEVHGLISHCEWFEVYDIIEAIAQDMPRVDQRQSVRKNDPAPAYFEREINQYFRKEGIGWQLVGGKIRIRGPEAFESAVSKAKETLSNTDRATAAQEIHEALQDLSRRPSPDITGAVQHGMATLECVVRDVMGDHKLTLGDLLKQDTISCPDRSASVSKKPEAMPRKWAGISKKVGFQTSKRQSSSLEFVRAFRIIWLKSPKRRIVRTSNFCMQVTRTTHLQRTDIRASPYYRTQSVSPNSTIKNHIF